jgi:hypothetical protein
VPLALARNDANPLSLRLALRACCTPSPPADAALGLECQPSGAEGRLPTSGNPSDRDDRRHGIKDDITELMAKTLTHPHHEEACREFPEVERALAQGKAFLEKADNASYGSEEAASVLDEVALALARLQQKFGW